MSYNVNDTVTVSVTYAVNGVATDATNPSLSVRDPSGTVTTHASGALTHTGTGTYTFALQLTSAGTWYWQWKGDGTAQPQVGTGVYYVSPDLSASAGNANDLITVDDVLLANQTPSGIIPDPAPLIQSYITLASNRIRNEFGHFTPYETAVTKTFLMHQKRCAFFPYFCESVSAVVISPESQALPLSGSVPDWQLEPFVTMEGVYTSLRVSPWIPAISPRSMRFGKPAVAVTGNWGFQTVPDAVKVGCLIAVRAWMLRDTNQYSTTVQSADPGVLPRPAGTYALPNAAREALALFTPTIGVA